MLSGGQGNDTLQGEAGNDQLQGGLGRDHLAGGEGEDVFVFRNRFEAGLTLADADTLSDLVLGEDLIDLSGIDARTAPAGDQAFVFAGNAAFTAAGEIRTFAIASTPFVEVDVNGDGVPDFVLRCGEAPALTAEAFML